MIEKTSKEQFNITKAISDNKTTIIRIGALSEQILAVLRGNSPKEEVDMKEECLLDTIQITGEMLNRIESNMNEIAKNILA